VPATPSRVPAFLAPSSSYGGGPRALIERNTVLIRRNWKPFLSVFAEPFIWLFSIGIGVGALVDGFVVGGQELRYEEFVAPAMLAAVAANGAIIDTTFNVFFKLRYDKTYEAMVATPLTPLDIVRGDLTWALVRGSLYSATFLLAMVAMGMISSPWALLALPAATLSGFAFGGVGFALTTFMRSWQDFEFVTLAMMPLLLFSATFFPVDAYPEAVRWVVEATPLYRAVVLVRELCTGLVSWASLVSVVYLAVMGWVGLRVAARRMDRILMV
jgi:lipooligosaccharide transport system permease protein